MVYITTRVVSFMFLDALVEIVYTPLHTDSGGKVIDVRYVKNA